MRIAKLICITLSAWLAVVGVLGSVASAQSVFDVTPPVIELDETREGIAGETQVFTAQVTDDLGLKDVKLYHRFAGQEPYEQVQMSRLGDTDYYLANVPTVETETRAIEYYIQARDNGGNRVIKGFAFEPYVRYLTQPEPAAQPSSPVAVDVAPEAPGSGEQQSGKFKWWYLVVGVLVAGGIAAAAGGGGGSNGGSTPATAPVTVNISNP